MQFRKLFEPGYIGRMELKNRIIMAPMGTNFASSDGYITERLKDYYEERAKGGVGLVTVGVVSIDAPRGNNLENQIAISENKFILGLNELTEAVHRHGARIAAQLVHGGKLAVGDIIAGIEPVSPSRSSIAMKESLREMTKEEFMRTAKRFAGMPRSQMSRELTVDEIKRLVGRFADAAERAKMACFDGVELHAAHGYLLSSFLSPASNKRKDEYGGYLKDRARFLLEVIGAIRGKVGETFPVWCRIDCREFGIKDGITPEDGRELAVMLEKAGVDAIHVSGYGGVVGGFIDAPLVYPPGHLVPYAVEIKKLVKIPVIAVGRISPELGESLLKQGRADFIAMGRPLVADPQLPYKLASVKREDIRPCLHCYRCVARHLEGEPIVCTVNPAAGREAEFRIQPAAQARRVVVVGGGPAGMETARLAALRGHRVTLYEKERRLGGSLLFASIVNADNEDFLNWLIRQVKRLPVEVRLGTEVEPGLVKSLNPDAVVVATGPHLVPPQIPGAERRNVLSGSELRGIIGGRHDTRKFGWWVRLALTISSPVLEKLSPFALRWFARRLLPVGQNVAIVGDDLVAIELAQYLVELGRKVTVLTDQQWMAVEMAIPARWRVMRNLRKSGVTLLTEVKYEEITVEGVIITDSLGERQTIKADTVILAGDTRLKPKLPEQLKDLPELHMAGDCVEVRLIPGAIEDATIIGSKL